MHYANHPVTQYENNQISGEGARPSRVTLQPISESKRVMSNPSRGQRGQSQEPFDQFMDGQAQLRMQQSHM